MTKLETNYIAQGDCIRLMKELPDGYVDAIITDPPYSSGGMTRSDKMRPPSEKYLNSTKYPEFPGDNRDTRSWTAWSYMWMTEALRVLKPSGYFLTFTDWRMLPTTTDAIQAAGVVWRGLIAWNKGPGARGPHKGYFRHQCEYVVWGSKGVLEKASHGGPWPGCYNENVRLSDKHHMTGKPTPLMRQLVQCCPPGGLILDPFCGSGTTCVAAKLEGRNFIGLEFSDEYATIAMRRLAGGDHLNN